MIYVWAIVAAVLVTAVLSAAEMAFIAANRVRIRHLAESGDPVSARYLEAFRHPERVLSAAMIGVNIRGLDRNVLVEIGLVVLVGLAAKNAILIVEFAKQAHDAGMTRYDAAVSAAKTRLRPILMTSLAFILGVVPLVVSFGAGAEMRQSLGTAVFFGMLGVTFFGLMFTPVFYVVSTGLSELRFRWRKPEVQPEFKPDEV